MFGSKTRTITADEALPGRDATMPVADHHLVLGTPLDAAVPRRLRDDRRGDGLLLGRGAQVLAGRRRVHHRGRLRRRLHAEPVVRRGVQRTHRPHRGGARGVRPRASPRTRPCSRCSGRTTTPPRACARATTSARSTARSIWWHRDAQREAAEAIARHVPAGADATPASVRSPPRSRRPGRSTTPSRTTSSTSPRTRTATAASAAPV